MLRIFFKYRNMCVTEKTSKERIRFERNPVKTLVSELQYRKQRYASVLYISRRRRTQTSPKRFFRKHSGLLPPLFFLCPSPIDFAHCTAARRKRKVSKANGTAVVELSAPSLHACTYSQRKTFSHKGVRHLFLRLIFFKKHPHSAEE